MNTRKILNVESRKHESDFYQLPFEINKSDPNWVGKLIIEQKAFWDEKKNPFFKKNSAQRFIAYDGKKPAGRIAAIINREYNDYHHDNTGFFGFIECVPDFKLFRRLMETAENWLKKRECDEIVGPANPSMLYSLGYLTKGFDTPNFILHPHNPAYYAEFTEKLGYTKKKDLYAWFLKKASYVKSEKITRVARAVEKRYPVTLRTMNMKKFHREIDIFYDIYIDAFQKLWGFFPPSRDEFHYVAGQLKAFIDEKMVFIAEIKGEPVGFLLSFPDFNEVLIKIQEKGLTPMGWLKFWYYKKKIRGIHVFLMAMKSKHHRSGIGSLLYERLIQHILNSKYENIEMGSTLEDNVRMNSIIKLAGGKNYKTYRIYTKSL